MYNIYNIHNHTMVKATRRVKRMKRSKKQVHRARGRKTNRRRYTRRQRGGREIEVCKKKGLIEAFASGIDITYDDETHLFKIGTRPTISDLETFNGKNRYERALYVLKQIGQIETQLDWHNFALFALIYCHTYTHPQCNQIHVFLENYSTSTDFDKNGEGRTIGMSIDLGKTQFNSGPYKRNIEVRFHAAPAAAAAAATASDVPDVAPNTLKVTMESIAYRGHARIVETFPTDISKREYKFKNFTILLNDRSVITGVLDVNFVTDSISKVFTTEFSLSLNVRGDELFQCISECLGKKTITDAVTIYTIKKTMMGMQINGTLSEKRVGTTSTYDFNDFVMKFAECHKDAKLEAQMADLSVVEPAKPTIKSIQSILNTTVEHNNILMRNIDHKKKNVYPDPDNVLNKLKDQAGALQLSCNRLTRALTQLPEQVEQAQLDAINTQASELFHDVKKLLAKCERITTFS